MIKQRTPLLPLDNRKEDPRPLLSNEKDKTTTSPKSVDSTAKLNKRIKVTVVVVIVLYYASSSIGFFMDEAFHLLAKFDKNGSFDRAMNHLFYNVLDMLDVYGEVNCMNYGYKDLSPDAKPVAMDAIDEPARYCVQMYDKIASASGDLSGRKVLEVGSGRGGGASYVKRYLHPDSVTGLDYSSRAVDFCNGKHAATVPGLDFVQGDAGNLPFGNAEFDFVYNVESSHCYANFTQFISGVYRVLKPGGHFSWVDFRTPDELPKVNTDFSRVGFTELKTEDVTPNVLDAMTSQSQLNRQLIDKRVPRIFRFIFYTFAGVEGSLLHNKLSERKLIYTHKLLVKKD